MIATGGLHLRIRHVGERGIRVLILVCAHRVTHSTLWPQDNLEPEEATRLLLFKHHVEVGCDCNLCEGCEVCDGPIRD
jgi:hypothetical protein